MALTNMYFKDQNWSHFWKESKPWRAKEEEEKRKRKKKGGIQAKIKLRYGCLPLVWNFKALYDKYHVSKSRVFSELHLNLRFLEIKVGKTHKEQDKQRILSFKMDSWLIESL